MLNIEIMQRPPTHPKQEATPSIPSTPPEGELASETHANVEPVEAGRSRYVSVGTEELADEDRRYSNVACTD